MAFIKINTTQELRNRLGYKIKITDYILLVLLIGLSVSPIEFFERRDIQFGILVLLGIAFFTKNKVIEPIVYKILIYAFFVQLFAMIRFDEFRIDRFLSLGLLYTRFLTAYFILKLGGNAILLKFEFFSFCLILIGLPLFFLVHAFPGIGSFLSRFDFNSFEIQREYGGWNIFAFVYSGWAGFRFCGYAYEPGGMALMITISWVLYIKYYGIKFNFRVLIYALAMIFTFSTTAYIVLFFLITFYIYNNLKPQTFYRAILFFIVLFVGIINVWDQDFIKGKIESYIERDEQTRESSGGYEQVNYSNVGRLSAIFVAMQNIAKWPFGHGTVENGRVKNKAGDVISGANGVAYFFVTWGVIGGFLFIYALYFLVKNINPSRYLKGRILLLIAIILVISSNSMGGRIITYTLLLFPYLYLIPYVKILKGRFNWAK